MSYCHVRILKYNYNTDEGSRRSIYTRQGIRGHALQLIKDLLLLREHGVRTSIRFLVSSEKGADSRDASV